MPILRIDCPEEVLISLKQDVESFQKAFRLAAAMKFYELGRLSSGRAAALAGISRVAFLQKAGEYRVPAFEVTPDELKEDVGNA